MNSSLFQTIASQVVSEAEIDKALSYLTETRDGVVKAVQGLSEAQWKFKPGPDRWSIVQVVEHLGVVEDFFLRSIAARLNEAPAGLPDRDPQEMDALILAREPDRSTKVLVPGRPSLAEAPPPIIPTGLWTPQDSLRRFLAMREKTAAFLQSPAAEHRRHAVEHPALGPLDGYQWVLFVAAHCERHIQQIFEVKADPHFPAN